MGPSGVADREFHPRFCAILTTLPSLRPRRQRTTIKAGVFFVACCVIFWRYETDVGRHPEIFKASTTHSEKRSERGRNATIESAASIKGHDSQYDKPEGILNRNNYVDRFSGGNTSHTDDGPRRIVIAVMGEARLFYEWYQRLYEKADSKQLSFIFGAFDSQVSHENQTTCKEQFTSQTHFQSCHVDYIPNTTWTQGRNLLARHILGMEEEQDRVFDYWIFADDDIELDCSASAGGAKSERRCWQHLVQQLYRSLLDAKKVTQLTVPSRRQISRRGWSGVSTYDANLAVFSRSAVPYLLPYATPLPGDSEYISQSIIFCITQTCFPSSVALIPDLFKYNTRHRSYSRSRISPETIRNVVHHNIGEYLDLNMYCTHEKFDLQMQDRIGIFSSLGELEEALPPTTNVGLCEPLTLRFRDWRQ
jgi:hypothetical protein